MCDGTITAEGRDILEASLRASESARLFYAAYMDLHGRMLWRFRGGRGDTIAAGTQQEGPVAVTAPVVPAKPSFFTLSGNTLHGTLGYFSEGWPVAYLIATLICGVSLLIGSLMPVSQPVQVARQSSVPSRTVAEPKIEVVGRISGMVDCQWADPSTEASPDSDVSLGRKFSLASGLMEITYDTGAKVVLQGPVTYEVESGNCGFMSVGRLTGKATTERARGLMIRTPTATVTDLGTEFGVEVSKEGNTTSHVFCGLIRLQVASVDGATEATVRVLHENESARVENRSGSHGGGGPVIVFGPVAKPDDFVREIRKLTIKTFDLVDVVAGGNGFSGRRNRGIDPTNGHVLDRWPNWGTNYIVGDGKYHRVEGLPFVDGVFIPDGSRGPVPIASTGLTSDEFPKTSNETAHAVWAGGAIPASAPSYPAPRTELGGIDYASTGHGLLFLHANKGITFDLAAIRRANPDRKLVRFRAAVGNTETSIDKGEAVTADVWVLVDGQARFRRREINRYTGAFSIAIPIAESDRFLTLAATDGGNGISWDWILFGDPRLELVLSKVASGSDSTEDAIGR